MSFLNTAAMAVVDRDNRLMSQAGYPMSEIINDIKADIDSGNIGITAGAEDVDSLALGGGHFVVDEDLSTALDLYWKAARFHNGLANVTVAAGHVTLSASNTNYVEVARDGTVYTNTSAFTSGRLPLWVVVTGTGTRTTTTSAKPLLQLIGTAGVVGSMLSTAGATKEQTIQIGALSATAAFCIVLPNVAGTVAQVSFVTSTTDAADDTDYRTFGIVNKGATGSGSTKIVDSTVAANSSKATGGTGTTAYVKRDLTLSTTPADLVVAAGDVLEITFTKVAAATDWAQCSIRIGVTFTA
jgi:hypothetical protein